MDPFTIASLVALVAGSYMQYQAADEAGNRQRDEIAQSLASQDRLQRQAEKKALDTAGKFRTEDRSAEQSQIADQVTNELMTPVSESQAIRAQQSTTQGETSDAYKTAKAKSDVETMKATEQLARLLGKSTSAGRLRMNEGIRMMDSGMDIDRLASFSRGQHGADQIAIQQAGAIDPTKQFVGSLLQAGGSAGLAGGGAKDLTSNGAALKYGTNAGSSQSSLLAAEEAGMGTGSLWNMGGDFSAGFGKLKRIFA